MTHPRFRVQRVLPDQTAVLSPEDAYHALNVLRLQKGDRLLAFTPGGEEYEAEIVDMGVFSSPPSLRSAKPTPPKEPYVKVVLVHKVREQKKSEGRLALACAVPKGKRLDILVEKATELGVGDLFFMETHHSVATLQDTSSEKFRHLQRKMYEAVKQCQRLDVPVLHPSQPFEQMLQALSSHPTKWIAHPDPDAPFFFDWLCNHRDQMASRPHVCILIGPEGGFTNQEMALSMEAGFDPIRLAPTILRIETATLSALSILQSFI